jgi:hypothetical protein
MDEETKKDTRQMMQKNDNAPCNNQPKNNEKVRQKEVNFSQENCLPKGFSEN